MGNAEELLDSLLELKSAGTDLRELTVAWPDSEGRSLVYWSSEMEIHTDANLVLYGD